MVTSGHKWSQLVTSGPTRSIEIVVEMNLAISCNKLCLKNLSRGIRTLFHKFDSDILTNVMPTHWFCLPYYKRPHLEMYCLNKSMDDFLPSFAQESDSDHHRPKYLFSYPRGRYDSFRVTKTTGSQNSSETWDGLTLIWLFHSSCPIALPILCLSLISTKQNWIGRGTAKNKVNPIPAPRPAVSPCVWSNWKYLLFGFCLI